ncbi:uncharacterized protein Cyt-b5 isoform X1 [Polyergus mexicanus]|uniref:uncharacterized protein Cyt-b5 isoform X1 n=1 Tax=Polyergus mexicanus TaxID=615972 RepID=UPI0038B6AC18
MPPPRVSNRSRSSVKNKKKRGPSLSNTSDNSSDPKTQEAILNLIASNLKPLKPLANDSSDSDMEVESISQEIPPLPSKQKTQSEKIIAPLDPGTPGDSNVLSSTSLKRQIQKCQGEDDSIPKKLNASRIIPDSVLNNRYTKSCQGPFEIVITSTGAANTSIHPLTVGRLLSSTLKKDILEIKKLGFSKISAQFKSRDAANNLINNPILNANNLIAYIPSYRVSRQGIIRNVPLDLSESTIKEEIDCSVGINSVRRLNRKVIDPSTRLVYYTPSKSIAITFEGQDIPQSLYLYMVRSSNIDRSLQILEQGANKLAAHLNSKGLEISPTKSALMVFSRGRKSPLSYSINLQDSVITSSPSHRFLGILLDPKLHGNLHMDFLANKCTKLLNILKSLRGVWWGANPVLLLNIYKALIRGSNEYSFPYICSNNFSHLEKLEKIQRQAIRLCLGLRQSTPSNVLLAKSGIGPLRFRLIYLASKFLLKSFASKDNLVIDKVFDLQISLINNNKFDISTNFILYRTFLKFKPYKSKIASFDQLPVYNHDLETSLFTADIHITPPSIVEEIKSAPFPQLIFIATFKHLIQERKCFFTDASKTDSQDYVGLAFYSHSPHTSRQYRIDGYASIFTGETLALLKCLDYILQYKLMNSSIFTDSRSLVEILLSAKPLRDFNYLILEIKERLRSAYLLNYNISIIWIMEPLRYSR